MAAIDELKKRKHEESDSGDSGPTSSDSDDMRPLLERLKKEQLVDLLAKLCCQYPYVAEQIKDFASADPVHRKLFVRGLAWETTSETLCAAFSVHGEIEEGAVIVDKPTGKSRGYGFITYKNIESTQRALDEASRLIDGRLAVCNLACEGLTSASIPADQALRKVYIGGLSHDVTTEVLLKFFGKHGEIEEGSVAYDKDTNVSRGFGFVTYKTADAAKKAIDDPNKSLGEKNITVKYAEKGKAVTPHMPSAVASVGTSVPTGYVYPGKMHALSGGIASYPYPQHPSPYASFPIAPSRYSLLHQIPYGEKGLKKEQIGSYPTSHAGFTGYPFFAQKP